MVSVSEVLHYFEQFFTFVIADQVNGKAIAEWEQFRLILWEEAASSNPTNNLHSGSTQTEGRYSLGNPSISNKRSGSQNSHITNLGINPIKVYLQNLAEKRVASRREVKSRDMPSPMNYTTSGTTATLESHKDSCSSNDEIASSQNHPQQLNLCIDKSLTLETTSIQTAESNSLSRQCYQSRTTNNSSSNNSITPKTKEYLKTTASPTFDRNQNHMQRLHTIAADNYSPILKEITSNLSNIRQISTTNSRFHALNSKTLESSNEKNYSVSFKINQVNTHRIETKENQPPHNIVDHNTKFPEKCATSRMQQNQKRLLLTLQDDENEEQVKRNSQNQQSIGGIAAEKSSQGQNMFDPSFYKDSFQALLNKNNSISPIPTRISEKRLITDPSDNLNSVNFSQQQKTQVPRIPLNYQNQQQHLIAWNPGTDQKVATPICSTTTSVTTSAAIDFEEKEQSFQAIQIKENSAIRSLSNEKNGIKLLYKSPNIMPAELFRTTSQTNETSLITPNQRKEIKLNPEQLVGEQTKKNTEEGMIKLEFNAKKLFDQIRFGLNILDSNTTQLDQIFSGKSQPLIYQPSIQQQQVQQDEKQQKPETAAQHHQSRPRAVSTFQPTQKVSVPLSIHTPMNQHQGSVSGISLLNSIQQQNSSPLLLANRVKLSTPTYPKQGSINVMLTQNPIVSFPQQRSSSVHQSIQNGTSVASVPQLKINSNNGPISRNQLPSNITTFRQVQYGRGPSDSIRSRSNFSRDSQDKF